MHLDIRIPIGYSFVVLGGLLAVFGIASNFNIGADRAIYDQHSLGINVNLWWGLIMAAFGGLKYIQFHPDDRIDVEPMPLAAGRLAELQAHLMLFYTGIARTASDVAASYVADIERRHRQLKALRGLVEEGIDLLVGGADLRVFGELLHESWQLKRGLSDKVSSPALDALYAKARSAGAVGGKLTGAGGGGFLLLFVPPTKRAAVLDALRGSSLEELIGEPGVAHRGPGRPKAAATPR